MLSCVDLSLSLDKTGVLEQSAYWICPLWTIISLLVSDWLVSNVSQMVTYYLWWVLWYFKEFKNAKLDKWQKMLLSLRSNPQTMSP